MRTIKQATMMGWTVLAATGAALVWPAAQAWAQPDMNNAPKMENPQNKGKNKKNRAGKMQMQTQEQELEMLAQITGKPLTDEQKQQARDAMTIRNNAMLAARETYVTALAKATGMEVDELKLKLREAMRNRNRNGQNADGMGGRRKRNRNAVPDAAPAAAPEVAAGA